MTNSRRDFLRQGSLIVGASGLALSIPQSMDASSGVSTSQLQLASSGVYAAEKFRSAASTNWTKLPAASVGVGSNTHNIHTQLIADTYAKMHPYLHYSYFASAHGLGYLDKIEPAISQVLPTSSSNGILSPSSSQWKDQLAMAKKCAPYISDLTSFVDKATPSLLTQKVQKVVSMAQQVGDSAIIQRPDGHLSPDVHFAPDAFNNNGIVAAGVSSMGAAVMGVGGVVIGSHVSIAGTMGIAAASVLSFGIGTVVAGFLIFGFGIYLATQLPAEGGSNTADGPEDYYQVQQQRFGYASDWYTF